MAKLRRNEQALSLIELTWRLQPGDHAVLEEMVTSLLVQRKGTPDLREYGETTYPCCTHTMTHPSYAQRLRDLYVHSGRVRHLAMAVAHELGCSDDTVTLVACGALLHDIGKLEIPDTLLYKPGTLTFAELHVMRQHPDLGANLLAPFHGLAPVADIVRTHHERYDGKGYPRGLREKEIPPGARIVTVADAYAAMTEDRVYASAISHSAAIDELQRCAGTQFDPKVVEAFISCSSQQFRTP